MVGLFNRGSENLEKKRNVEKIKQIKKLVKEKRYEQALKTGTEYLQKVPHNQDVLFIVGGLYYMKNKHKSAISYFEKALEIGQYDTEVLLLKANSHFQLGETKKVMECCEKIKEIDPKNKAVQELLEKIESKN